MLGFGKKKIPAAAAARMFVEIGTIDAAQHLLRWETQMSHMLTDLRRDPTALHTAIAENPESVELFAGVTMATGMLSPKNLFPDPLAQSINSHVARELATSGVQWLAPFVFDLVRQFQERPAMGFMPFALVKELGVGERDRQLEEFMLGPIFMLALQEFEMTMPITLFWKRLSDDMKITA